MSTPIALQQPDTPYRMRPVLMRDVDALRADVWAHYEDAYARKLIDRVQKYAIEGRGLGIVVEDASRLIAYGQMTLWTTCAEISDLIVSESYRGQGIGTAMIQHLTQHARAMFMDCIEIGAMNSNVRALDLYRRMGFEDYKTFMLNVGQGVQPVTYLRLSIPR